MTVASRAGAAALAGLLGAACGRPDAGAAAPPNVLVVVLDTTRADRCSFLGYERETTPRLEEFAREAVTFADAWSPGSWTFPAHVSLFTGATAADGGVDTWRRPVLPDSAETLAETLAAAGWATGCFTGNAWIAPHAGLSQGFGTVVPTYRPPARETAAEAGSAALAFMRTRRAEGRRFFAFVNVIEPHAPWTPEPEFQAAFVDPATPADVVTEARSLRYPRTALAFAGKDPIGEDLRRTAAELYDAEVAQVDAEVGRLLDSMRAEGFLDTTLVVITSDHGEGLGDHGWMEHGVLLHRELLRVPLVVRPPRGCEPRVVRDVVRLQDVHATVLQACGLPARPGADARPLLGETSGRLAIAAERTRDDMYRGIVRAVPEDEAATFRRARRSVYDGRFHLIVDDAGGVELYDVKSDPAERVNLAASEPGTASRLRTALGER